MNEPNHNWKATTTAGRFFEGLGIAVAFVVGVPIALGMIATLVMFWIMILQFIWS